jgi:hypothetical protein
MARLSRLILAFTIVYVIFIVGPAFLTHPFGPFPLQSTGDALDVVTPLVLIPFYWVLYRLDGRKPLTSREMILFLIFAAAWAEGQGMHLSSNSIGHLVETGIQSQGATLTHFYDEILSHYLWHIGVIGLTALLLARQWQNPFIGSVAQLREEAIAALLYGVTFFITFTEAGTAPLGIPFTLIVTIFGFTVGRRQLRQQPMLAFFTIAQAIALALFVIWFIVNGFKLPQFSELGLIA